MTSAEELAALRQLSKLLTDEEREAKKQTERRRGMLAVALMVLVVAFMPFVMQADLVGLIAAAVAAIAGSVVGFAMYWSHAAKQWPVIKPHIDVDSVSKRINTLDA